MVNDSVEETQIQSGAISAECGDVKGSTIHLITRFDTNGFRGPHRWDRSAPAGHSSAAGSTGAVEGWVNSHLVLCATKARPTGSGKFGLGREFVTFAGSAANDLEIY